MEKIIVLYRKLWNFDLQRKKHGRLPKTIELGFIMEKYMVKYQNIRRF